MTPTDQEYYRAGIADAVVENLSPAIVHQANIIASNGVQFFTAIEASIRLGEIIGETQWT